VDIAVGGFDDFNFLDLFDRDVNIGLVFIANFDEHRAFS
jgi:hypothetical protein